MKEALLLVVALTHLKEPLRINTRIRLICQVMVAAAHAFKASTREAEADGPQ